MSRLFEALQISELEKSGTTPSDVPVDATELLRASEKQEGILEQTAAVHVSLSPESRLVCLAAEHSLAAEKFRFMAVRLRQLQQLSSLKKILITSTVAEEGKSFVAANLALTMARKRHQKVLLIEGDLRRPQLAHEFGLGPLPGLSELLASENGFGNNIYHLERARLCFLPAGKTPENPIELMQSGRLPELVNQISARFDWVIIDSPPILPVADSTVWSRLADGVVLVTREGFTQKRPLMRGLEAIGRSNLVGMVINSCSDVDESSYYRRYCPEALTPSSGNGSAKAES